MRLASGDIDDYVIDEAIFAGQYGHHGSTRGQGSIREDIHGTAALEAGMEVRGGDRPIITMPVYVTENTSKPIPVYAVERCRNKRQADWPSTWGETHHVDTKTTKDRQCTARLESQQQLLRKALSNLGVLELILRKSVSDSSCGGKIKFERSVLHASCTEG